MKKRIVAKSKRALGRIAGWVTPRPKNLIVVPRDLAFRESPGGVRVDSPVIAAGRDLAQVIAGCGGLLFLHRAGGGTPEIFVSASPRDDEREMARAAGMFCGSVTELRDRLRECPAERALCLLPFPPGESWSFVVGSLAAANILFYESGFLLLPDATADISAQAGKKLDFLSGLGAHRSGDLAQELSAYRSGSTREGKGWSECFLSLEAMKSVAGAHSRHRERESFLQFLSAIHPGPVAD
jgi:hypothetical protein